MSVQLSTEVVSRAVGRASAGVSFDDVMRECGRFFEASKMKVALARYFAASSAQRDGNVNSFEQVLTGARAARSGKVFPEKHFTPHVRAVLQHMGCSPEVVARLANFLAGSVDGAQLGLALG